MMNTQQHMYISSASPRSKDETAIMCTNNRERLLSRTLELKNKWLQSVVVYEKAREAEALRVSEENRIRQAQQRQTQIDDRIEAEANQRYRDDPGAKSYSGGFDKSTNNYNDPFDPGETE